MPILEYAVKQMFEEKKNFHVFQSFNNEYARDIYNERFEQTL